MKSDYEVYVVKEKRLKEVWIKVGHATKRSQMGQQEIVIELDEIVKDISGKIVLSNREIEPLSIMEQVAKTNEEAPLLKLVSS